MKPTTAKSTASDAPHPIEAIDAEEAVLGALMIDREALDRVAAFLDPSAFSRERNGLIFSAMLALHARNEPRDFVTLCGELERMGKLAGVGGAGYLAGLANATPTAAFAEHYARVVEKTGTRRAIVRAASVIVRLAYDVDDPNVIIDQAETTLYALRRGRNAATLIDPAERVRRACARYEAAQQGQLPGIPYGLRDLDDITQGAHQGELVIVAGRPSIGKTSLMQCMAEHQASAGLRVLFCSAEMPESQLSDRYFAAQVGCTVHSLEGGRIEDEAWTALSDALGAAEARLPYVFDQSDMTTAAIRSMATEMRSRHGLDAIYVDYVQILHDRVREGEVERVTLISRNLKEIARALDVPVIVASQLNRSCEGRANKMPQLADLRESGSLEQDADVVLLLFRPQYYFSLQEWHQIAPKEPWENACKVIIGKQRNGPRGVHVYLRFDQQAVRFSDLDLYHQEVRYTVGR